MVLALIKKPITRSRNPDRIMIPNLQARNRSKDVLRRTMYLQHLVQNKPDEVDKYISSLHIRTIQRILKYLTSERRGESFNEVFTILRQSFLSKFPVPNVTSRNPPLLQIVGYTSALADVVPLRALYNDPSLLVLLPQGEFKDTIRTTIPAFHYGATMDRFLLNGTNVGRDHDQQSTCICHLPCWKPYVRLTKSGRRIVLTTDVSCLGNAHAQAVLDLQAGFRTGFAPCLPGKSYQNTIISSVVNHSKSLCSRLHIHEADILPWRRDLIREIKHRINEQEVGLRHKPLTGWIDFDSSISAFRNWRKYLVITRVDKAANCLCIICKACYVQLSKAEMESPGYSRVEGEDLVSIKSVIVKRQWNFLRQEFLPIPQIRSKRSDGNPLQIVLAPTDRLPVRYITVKLHKNPVATRGITACCGSPMDGIARIVNACLMALRPVLHASWREKCSEIGILADECWITSSGAEIIDIWRAVDFDAKSQPRPLCPH